MVDREYNFSYHLEAERDRILKNIDLIYNMNLQKTAGMKFLKNPDIFNQIIQDLETPGYAGEDLNKKLIFISRASHKNG